MAETGLELRIFLSEGFPVSTNHTFTNIELLSVTLGIPQKLKADERWVSDKTQEAQLTETISK